jgi:hypothetical protein
MVTFVGPKHLIVDGEMTISPTQIKELTEDLSVGDKVEIDFNGYGILIYKESIKGRSSYRIIAWDGYPPDEGGRKYRREWKNFETGKGSTFMENLHRAFRRCGLDPEGIELKKEMNDA